MLFFGGYSSILPYVLYLSVVWICILVGIKGDIQKIFSNKKMPEYALNADISKSDYDTTYTIPYHDENSSDAQKNVQSALTFLDDNSFELNEYLLSWIAYTFNQRQSDHISFHFLRGPPVSVQ